MEANSINLKKPDLEVQIIKPFFRDQINCFTLSTVKILRANIDVPTTEPVIKGYFSMIAEDDLFSLWGKWVNHPKGPQFQVEYSSRIYPATLQGQEEFLRKGIKGVGPKKAKAIVKTLGIKTIDLIKENWEVLLSVPGIGENLAQHIYKEVMKHSEFDTIAVFLLGMGISYKTAVKIYDIWGSATINKIEANPYCLCEIPGIGFLKSDEYARNKGIKLNSNFRLEAGILYVLEFFRDQQGHVYLPKPTLIAEAIKLLNPQSIIKPLAKVLNNVPANSFVLELEQTVKVENIKLPVTADEVSEVLNNLIQKDKLIEEEGKIYLPEMHGAEIAIARKINHLLQATPRKIFTPDQIEKAISNFEKRKKVQLDIKQREAVQMAINSGFSVLTGGPGTGKTMTCNAIIEVLSELEPRIDIRCAAPTGKAAKRLAELTGREASTIHRMLGLKKGVEIIEGEFKADFLISDESSMIDQWLASQLLKAIQLGTRVLFVGDVDQLPPVGSGNVFKDLIESGCIPIARLATIFRQAQESQIVMNAHRIINGRLREITCDRDKGDFYFVHTQDKQKVADNIIEAIDRLLKKGLSFAEIQVLSPIRKGDLGVNVLNELIQRRFNPSQGPEREVKIGMATFRIGDKVMQTKNNYNLEVYNGETGVVIDIRREINEDGETNIFLDVDYDDRVISYKCPDEAEDLVLAYCISIHKSQGSEYKAIIIPIHSTHTFFLHRNLIYTAITRAKQMVVLIGEWKTFLTGCSKKNAAVRYTYLAPRLQTATTKAG